MGAFFLSNLESKIDFDSVESVYAKKGFNHPYKTIIGDYCLLLYQKQLLTIENHSRRDSIDLFTCGSFCYQGKNYKDSIQSLLKDFQESKLLPEKLFGNYVLIFFNEDENRVYLYTDPCYIKNVYFEVKSKIISSDYLSILVSTPYSYKINQLSVFENLLTGGLISPDTYVDGIYKLDRINSKQVEVLFPNLKVCTTTPNFPVFFRSKRHAISNANTLLSDYFKSLKELCNDFGAHIGLTGGFDSRLLLMHARKEFSKLVTNSFWRPNSIEYANAKKLVALTGLNFYSFENDRFTCPPLYEMLETSLYFFDGQIRSQNNWDEEFNMPDYTAQISQGYFVGFHGCGGEQYRNSDRLIKQMRVDEFIKYDLMFRQCGNAFKGKELFNAVYENIERKIKRQIDLLNNKIGLIELKRFQNELWNPANRCTRVNALNQQMFYFAPFSEYQLAQSAYAYIPFLGKSLAFQMEMMRLADPELSSAMTNYGFSVLEGEPLRLRIIPYCVNFIPRPLFYYFFRLLRRNQAKKPDIIMFKSDFLNQSKSKISYDRLAGNKNLKSVLFSFDFLLSKFEQSGKFKS